MGQFLSIDSFSLYSSSKLLASDAKNGFLFSKNLFLCDLSLFVYNFPFYCLSFCSNVSNCLCMWSDYKIVFFVIYFTFV